MRISNEQIQYIDKYLQFLNVKFIDVRVELIDHLASEFENNSENLLLEDFLRTKKTFVEAFQRNLHSKKHWAYQKRLSKRILGYFTKPKYLILSQIIALFMYWAVLNLTPKIQGILFIATISIPHLLHLYIYKKPKDMHQKIQSAKYMMSIMSFPSLFLYASLSIFPQVPEKSMYFACFWFIGIICNLAGLEEVLWCKKQVLRQYKQLVKA